MLDLNPPWFVLSEFRQLRQDAPELKFKVRLGYSLASKGKKSCRMWRNQVGTEIVSL